MDISFGYCITFNEVNDILLKNNIKITGVMHIGAHECEELHAYNKLGVANEDIIWIEAINEKVIQAKNRNIPNVYNAVITDKDDDDIIFNISNYIQASSVLELGFCSREHPNIVYINQIHLKSITINSFFERNNINENKYNLWNFDIQGAELMALKGATKYIKYAKAIFLEICESELYAHQALLKDIDLYLSQYNFKRVITKFTPFTWGEALYIIDT
jgi:hypothetical protein